MFKNIAKSAAMAAAAIAAAGDGLRNFFTGGPGFARADVKTEYDNKTLPRSRGYRRLSWAESKKTYGITRSPSGYANRDNPAGTKLGRLAAKGMLTKNGIH